jgi:hypothetical protein
MKPSESQDGSPQALAVLKDPETAKAIAAQLNTLFTMVPATRETFGQLIQSHSAAHTLPLSQKGLSNLLSELALLHSSVPAAVTLIATLWKGLQSQMPSKFAWKPLGSSPPSGPAAPTASPSAKPLITDPSSPTPISADANVLTLEKLEKVLDHIYLTKNPFLTNPLWSSIPSQGPGPSASWPGGLGVGSLASSPTPLTVPWPTDDSLPPPEGAGSWESLQLSTNPFWKSNKLPLYDLLKDGQGTPSHTVPEAPCPKWEWLNADGPIQNIPKTVTLQHLFQVLKDLEVNGCVAGGAATAWKSAADIDLFVFGSQEDAESVATTIGHHTWADSSGVPDDYPDGNVVIATCYPLWANKPIQVIRSGKPDAAALLDDFDLSVHMHAIVGGDDGHPVYFSGTKATLPGDSFKVYKHSGHTTARIEKLSKRYNVPYEDCTVGAKA